MHLLNKFYLTRSFVSYLIWKWNSIVLRLLTQPIVNLYGDFQTNFPLAVNQQKWLKLWSNIMVGCLRLPYRNCSSGQLREHWFQKKKRCGINNTIDIWIGEETDLGKGYGTKMMQLALIRCFADPAVTAILIDPLVSNTRVHRFYERLGFQIVDRRRFGDDDCLVYRLNRVDWHQESIG